MHNPLEEYLYQLSEHLTPMPVKRRNEELREMRQHLLNAIIVSREFGQDEEAAAANAIEQFGLPQELAASHIAAWRRGRKGLKRDLLGATACAFVFLSLLPRLVLTMEQVYNLPAIQSLHSSLWITIILLLWQLPTWLVAGAVTGLLFPRRAVAGTVLVIVAWDLAIVAQDIVNAILTARPWHLALIETLIGLRALLFNGGPYDFTAILAAWVASRWRLTLRGRTESPAT